MTVRSAGLIGKWQGQPANPSMINAARRLGLDLPPPGAADHPGDAGLGGRRTGDGRPPSSAPSEQSAGRTTPRKRGLYLPGLDVPHPMGKGDNAFNDCGVLIEAGTALHVGPRPPVTAR